MRIFKKRRDIMKQAVPLLKAYGLDQLRGKDMLISGFANGYFYSLNGTVAGADFEDLFMDTVNDFVQSLHTPDIVIQNYEAYFYRIFKNKVANFKMKRYDEIILKDEYRKWKLSENEKDIYDEELINKLFRYIDRLPQQCKNLILMKYYEAKTHKEIAMLLNITEQSSKVQLARCKKKLLHLLINK